MVLVKLYRGVRRRVVKWMVSNLPYFRFIKHPQNPTQHIDFDMWYKQKVCGYNYDAYWPMHFTSKVTYTQHIRVGKGSFPGFMPGCYIQGIGGIRVGKYSIFSANVGIISANHDLHDSSIHNRAQVIIGSYCWVGMNATILPGVELGDYTIVGAGAVVTRSFPEGYCVIGGNPARLIKKLDPEACKRYEMNDSEYHGYLPEKEFAAFADKNLSLPPQGSNPE